MAIDSKPVELPLVSEVITTLIGELAVPRPGEVRIERLSLSFPLEWEWGKDENGKATLCGSPPIHITETSFETPFGKIALTLEEVDG